MRGGASSLGAGGIIASQANVLIEGTLIAEYLYIGNIFGAYGAGLFSTSNTTVRNCTIVGNRCTSGGNTAGGSIWGAAQLVNTIVRDNLPDQLASPGPVSYSEVTGGQAGLGNFDADLLFAGAPGDWHLAFGSPCIDSGDPSLLDPDGSRSDVGAYAWASLYPSNAGDPALWTSASWNSVSTLLGGQQRLHAELGGALGGDLYLTLGSFSGTQPGFSLDGQGVPLTPDAYTQFCLAAQNSLLLSNSLGLVDAQGRAELSIHVPSASPPALVGLGADHALVTIDLTSFAVSSGSSPVRLTFGQ